MNLSDLTPDDCEALESALAHSRRAAQLLSARVTLTPGQITIRWAEPAQGREYVPEVVALNPQKARALESLRDALGGIPELETPAGCSIPPAQTGDSSGGVGGVPAAPETPVSDCGPQAGDAAGGAGDTLPAVQTFGRVWTQAEDDELVAEAVRRGPGYVASLLCRFMAPKLGRTEGSVKLRLYRPEIAERIADGHEAMLRAPKAIAEPASKLAALAVPDNWSRAADLAMCEDLFRGVNLKRQSVDKGVSFDFLSNRFAALKTATIGRVEMSVLGQKAMLAQLREAV